MVQIRWLAACSARPQHLVISLKRVYSHLVSGAEGKNEKQILIARTLDVVLGSNGEKYHIANVNIKLCGTPSINNAHLRKKKTSSSKANQIKYSLR